MNFRPLILLLTVVFFAWQSMGYGEDNSNLLQMFVRNKFEDNLNKQEKIKLSKFLLVNGDLNRAKYHLNTLFDLGHHGELIKLRYLSYIAFVEDNFDGVINQSTSDFQFYPQICTLNVLAYLMKGDISQTKKEFINCKIRTGIYNQDDYFWLTNLIKLKENILKSSGSNEENHPSEKIQHILAPKTYKDLLTFVDSVNSALLWLKLGLYAGLHDDIITLLPNLPEEVFESHRFREIMALIYFRNKDHPNAKKFLEDVDTANAHNILAGIYLKQNKTELAFAEYKLALLKKHNSRNALEKIIPLSYILSDYNLGLDSINQLEFTGVNQTTLSIFRSIFLLRNKNYFEAWKALSGFDLTTTTHIPDRVFQMKNFLSILLNYSDEIDRYSNYACNQFDGLSCWVQTQLLIWPDFSKHFKRTSDQSPTPLFTSTNLIETWEVKNIKEDLIVDQENLQQLDETQDINNEIAKNIF
ncbi:MAG: hypothetical protein A2381_06715 [Bdellovibrionales bacterium RIFOXYB1_FULL_37_110]|nr:MAG: hypothetical protein A2417_19565 [Bdellovibrionales bacterium RIFOXYC1_FULL_37_79]OFZ57671.1 MAG: hypothetical protein A2381_06715 [Bdellovibrionales bacterium RIFOXYB1_FULL_37_110]OFZ61438.1 MAG: hypothetical protein A2577_01080 [Bdellovibrionales bacterium RIFOXYD1_FULL_36_51]